MAIIRIKPRAEYKIKKWVEELKRDKNRRRENMRKNMGQLSHEIGSYFEAKAKDRKFFY